MNLTQIYNKNKIAAHISTTWVRRFLATHFL